MVSAHWPSLIVTVVKHSRDKSFADDSFDILTRSTNYNCPIVPHYIELDYLMATCALMDLLAKMQDPPLWRPFVEGSVPMRFASRAFVDVMDLNLTKLIDGDEECLTLSNKIRDSREAIPLLTTLRSLDR
jgi:hypothetical protein